MAKLCAYYTTNAVGDIIVCLYQDGALVKMGPQEAVLAYAVGMLGIERIYSDDCLLGQDSFDNIAKTIEEINVFKSQANAATAAAMRAQAADLLRQAAILVGEEPPTVPAPVVVAEPETPVQEG